MKRLLLGAVVLAALAACNSNETTGDMADSSILDGNRVMNGGTDTGWTPVFDGNALSNWHVYGKNDAGNTWRVDSNTIHLVPVNGEGGDLVTNDEYGDFHLKLQWKISKNGNSGILLYVQDDTAKYKETYFTGLEMQVLDNNGTPTPKLLSTALPIYTTSSPARPKR